MNRSTSAAAVLLGTVLLLLPALAGAESDSSRLNRDRKEVGRTLVEIQSSNWMVAQKLYTGDIEYHDPIVTIEGLGTMMEFLARMFGNTPDLVTTVEDETCINGIYTATWVMTGAFNGVPYTAPGVSIIKFRPGETQAYYQRDYYTEGDIMSSIPGLDEAVAGFRVYYLCAVDPLFDCPLPPPGVAADKSDGSGLPERFELQQNVPNPFNPATRISFDVPAGGENVTLRIYDVSGRLVRTLVDGFEAGGARSVTWDGRDDQGRALASGTYHYRMTAGGYSEKRAMVLVR